MILHGNIVLSDARQCIFIPQLGLQWAIAVTAQLRRQKLGWLAKGRLSLPLFLRVVVTQCVNKDLRKTFHYLGIGFCQSGQMQTDLIFGSVWVLPLQTL